MEIIFALFFGNEKRGHDWMDAGSGNQHESLPLNDSILPR